MAALVHGATNKPVFGFSPTSIPDCYLWLDAADSSAVTTSGSTVTGWLDRSGKNNHATSVNGTPTYVSNVSNGLSAIQLSSGNSNIGSSSFTAMPSSDITMFFAGTMNTTTPSNGVMFTLGPSSGTVSMSYTRNGTTNATRFTNGVSQVNTGTVTLDSSFSTSAVYTSGTGSPLSFALNEAASRTTSTLTISTSTMTGYRVGNTTISPSSTVNWYGYIFEILIYNRALSAFERQQVSGYLFWKWKTPLSSWTPAIPTVFPYYVTLEAYARPFEPPDADNLVLWLDGDDPSTVTTDINGRVTSWVDKRTRVGAAAPYTEPTGPTVYRGPVYDANTGSLFFDNSGVATKTANQAGLRLMTAGATSTARNVFLTQQPTSGNIPSIAGNLVCFIVYNNSRSATTTTNSLIQFRDSASPTFSVIVDIGMGSASPYVGPVLVGGAVTIGYSTTTAWSTSGSYSILAVIFTRSSISVRMNGTFISTTTGSNVTLAQPTIFTIGAHIDSRTFTGYINEILCYDVMALTAGDIIRIEGYLAHKWGLQSVLPSTHAFKSIPPSVSSVGNMISTNYGNVGSYNKYGDFRWRVYAGNSAGGQPNAVAVDSYGNMFMHSTTDVYTVYNRDDTLVATVTSAANLTGVLVCYFPSGYVRWFIRWDLTANNEFGLSVATDSADNVILGGGTGSTSINFYQANTSLAATLTGVSGNVSGIIAKYNNAGTYQWSAKINVGASSWCTICGLFTDSSNNIYALIHDDPVTVTVFNSSNTSVVTLNRVGNASGVIVKYSPTGAVLNYTRIGATTCYLGQYGSVAGINYNSFSPVAMGGGMDSSANLFFGGYFTGTPLTAYNHPGTTASLTITNSGTTNGFIAKYTNALVVSALAKIGGTSNDYVFFTGTDSSGNVYACGTFTSGTLTFFNANGSAGGSLTKGVGAFDGFLAKYTNDLTFVWAAQISGTSGTTVALRTLKVDNATGNVLVAGDTTSGTTNFFNAGQSQASEVFVKRGTGSNCFICRYDSVSGRLIYLREYGTIAGANNLGSLTNIATDAISNSYIVTGYGQSPNVTKYFFNN